MCNVENFVSSLSLKKTLLIDNFSQSVMHRIVLKIKFLLCLLYLKTMTKVVVGLNHYL